MIHKPCNAIISCGLGIAIPKSHICTLDVREHPEHHICMNCGFKWKIVRLGVSNG